MIKPVQRDLYGVVGMPVAHSLSPAMMGAAFQALGVKAVYVALEVDRLEDELEALRRVGFRGLSVTLPHKETAFRLCREADEAAAAMKAVNTLKRCRDGWEGINTDWTGALRALESAKPPETAQTAGAHPLKGVQTAGTHPLKGVQTVGAHPGVRPEGAGSVEGKRAGVLGAGGVARAVVYGLARRGARVTIANRDAAKGRRLAEELDCAFVPVEDWAPEDFDLVVQCTPVGMEGGPAGTLLPSGFFRPSMTVMDTVYRPLRTPFLEEARAAGAATVSGLDMLLYQGMAQLEWWTGLEAPEAAMRRALEAGMAEP